MKLVLYQVKPMEVLLFTKHLQTMIKSGIPLDEALEALMDQANSKYFQQILATIRSDIQNGDNLTKSFGKFPEVFSNFYLSMVEVGEKSGRLEENLDYLNQQLKKDYLLKKKVQGALLYPTIVLLTATMIGGSVGFFILPRLANLFSGFDNQLPLATQFLIGISKFMKLHGLLVLGSLLMIAISFLLAIQTKLVKPWWHSLLIRLPLVGKLVKYGQLSQLSRNLSVLIKSGVPLSSSIEICSQTLQNTVYKTSLMKVYDKVESGEPLAEAFKDVRRLPIYPVIVYKMVNVGEKTATLDEVFSYLSDYYDDEIDNVTQNISSILEPVLLLGMGLLVGFVALAVISPIYQFTQAVRGF